MSDNARISIRKTENIGERQLMANLQTVREGSTAPHPGAKAHFTVHTGDAGHRFHHSWRQGGTTAALRGTRDEGRALNLRALRQRFDDEERNVLTLQAWDLRRYVSEALAGGKGPWLLVALA